MNAGGQLTFERLEKHYGARHVLSVATLTLAPGRILHLAGQNGAGKTTLLKILAGLEAPDACDVAQDGRTRPWRTARRQLRRDVVYLHQSPFMFDDSVANNIGYGLRVTGVGGPLRRQRIAEALERMGLGHAARRNARTLSGGEQQRLALARAWVLRPRVLLLDEPTANMDSGFRRQTWSLLQDLRREDLAIMVSSHELSEADGLDCRTLHLRHGRLDADPPALQLVGDDWRPAPRPAGALP